MRAEILLTVPGGQAVAGAFVFDGKEMSIEVHKVPDMVDMTPMMRDILASQVAMDGGRRSVNAFDHPEEWLRNLPHEYSGTMIRAKFIDDDDAQALDADDDAGKRVTLNGVHVFIEHGKITKGPKDMIGKAPHDVSPDTTHPQGELFVSPNERADMDKEKKLEQTREVKPTTSTPQSSESTKDSTRRTNIKDVTAKYIGRSIILTGQKSRTSEDDEGNANG